MVKEYLVTELVEDGAALLEKLDESRFPVESMFWLHLPEVDYWRLVIASAFVNTKGAAAAYRRLDEVFSSISPAGLSLSDISLLEPDSQQFKSYYSIAESSGWLASGPRWVKKNDAVVYRWNGDALTGKLSQPVVACDLESCWEAERELGDYPALLIRTDGNQITLRLHPKYGQTSTLKSLKQAFQIALHRPNARPDCKISWLD